MNSKVIIIQNIPFNSEGIPEEYAKLIICNYFRKVFFCNNNEIWYDWDDEDLSKIDLYINNLSMSGDISIKITNSRVIDNLLSSWDYYTLNQCTNKKDIIIFHLAWNLI